MTSFTTVVDDVTDNLATYHNELAAGIQKIDGPQGWLQNGYISRTVASNNITVAVKTLAGADPSSTDPVSVRIGNTVRQITAALAVTKNAGTNWFNSGGTELAAQEIDYFVYIGYNATDGVVIGFARFSHGRVYSDFSTTATDASYCAISTITTAAATDEYELVGRFNATLSATASFNWSVPATSIVLSKPVDETRWLTWAPVTTGFSADPTFNTKYKIMRNRVELSFVSSGGTSNATGFTVTAPYPALYAQSYAWGNAVDNGSVLTGGGRVLLAAAGTTMTLYKDFASAAWTNSAAKNADFQISYAI